MMSRTGASGVRIFVIGVIALLVVLRFAPGHHIVVNPPHICLIAGPSPYAILYALRFTPGDGVSGIGNDGLTYDVRQVECPRWNGVGTPKVAMSIRILHDDHLLAEGTLDVGMIDTETVIIIAFVPAHPITASTLAQIPALHAFVERFTRQ